MRKNEGRWSVCMMVLAVGLTAAVAMAGTVTPVSLYSSTGWDATYTAANLIDGNQKNFGLSWSAGTIVLDLGQATDIRNIGVTGRNLAGVDTMTGISISVFDNDDPATGTLQAAGSWTGSGGFAQNRGQIVAVTNPVSKRYVQVTFSSGGSSGSQVAEVTVNQDVLVADASAVDLSWPLGQMANNNIANWGRPGSTASQTGWLILDTGNPDGAVSGLTLTPAIGNQLPKTGTVKASNDLSSFTQAAVATFNNPNSYVGYTNEIAFDSSVTQRYLLLEWDSIQPGGGGPARFADIDLMLVPEPATLLLLGVGGMTLLRRKFGR